MPTSRHPSAPPRFILGFALLFWGFMTDSPIAGISLAILFEAAHWTKLRWDFDDQAFLRAWHLSALLISVRMVLILVDGGRFIAVPRLLGWLPLLMAPVQFAQSYALKDRMPLSTFSFFARRRMLRNVELGLPVHPVEVNFGVVYLPMTVLSCTLGEHADTWYFLTGILVITGWAVFATGHARKGAVVLALLLAVCMTLGGQAGLRVLYSSLIRGGEPDDEESSLSHYRTAIGSRGEVKQSTQILWRLKALQGPMPTLLHTAIFNNYDRSVWSYRVPPEQFGKVSDFDDLKPLDGADGLSYFLANPAAGREAVAAGLPRLNLRGVAKSNSALPVPGSVTALSGFEFQGQARNAVGTIRIFPDEAISNGILVWDGLSSPERPPWTDTPPGGKHSYLPDLRISRDEVAAVREVVDQLNLRALPLREKLPVLKEWFATHFRYTRYLSIDANRPSDKDPTTALSIFLRKSRAGHCEYFATATTLILREAGVPARYAIGYAVMEQNRSRGEAVVRGIHGHAWCRVWDEENQRWFDFDTTPPSWIIGESQRTPWYQAFQDWMQRQREDFALWRSEPGNSLIIGIAMSAIGLIGALFIVRNLWKSRKRIQDPLSTRQWNGPSIPSPLHDLEPIAAKWLGPRPAGTPLGPWLKRLPPIEGLEEAVELHQRLRFDPEILPDTVATRLAELAGNLRSVLLAMIRKRPRKQW